MATVDTRTPAELVAAVQAAYNAGDKDAVEDLFEADAVVVATPGQPVVGDERRRVNGDFITMGLTFEIRVKHVYHFEDLALLLTDSVAEGPGPDGEQMRMAGVATDVIRRGPDGNWRYVIDNPWGVGDGPG